MLMITSGHRTIFVQLIHVTDQYQACADKMSSPGRKRAACSDDDPPPKKRSVSAKTLEKWIAENNKALSTSTWLKYVRQGRSRNVATLKCCMHRVSRQAAGYAQLQQCVYRRIEEPAELLV